MSLCRGLQQVTRSQLGAVRQPVVLTGGHQTRRLSTVPLTPRIQTHAPRLCVPGSSRRNYWWSSKSATSLPEPSLPRENDNLLVEESKPLPQQSNETPLDDSASTLTPTELSMADHPWVSSASDVSSVSVPPPPLQLGDLKELGFSNLTPVGAVQTFLEFVQVTTGLPWWGSITLTTVLARIAIFPFSIKTTRATARMAPVRPQMDALMKEVGEARTAGEQIRMQIAVIKLKKLRDDNGLGFGASMAGPLAQGVTSISMFIAIKRLCDYPLEQLKHEGVGWITSLSVPDPYYILPTLSVAIMNLQFYVTASLYSLLWLLLIADAGMQLGRSEMAAGGQHMLHFANGFRVLTVLFFPVVAHMPAGLLIHLVVNISLVAIQSVIMRRPAVRRALNIPPLPQVAPRQFPTMMETWGALRQWFRDQKTQAAQKAQEKARVPAFPAQSSSPTPLRRNTKQATRGKKS